MTGAVGKLVTRTPAWSGDFEEVKRLARLVDEGLPQDGPTHTQQMLAIRGAEATIEESEQIERESSPTVVVNERELALEHSGSIADLERSEEVSWSRVRRLRISKGQYGASRRINVEITNDGARVEVIGEPQFLRATSAILTAEVRKNAPWWGVLRTVWAAVAAAGLAFCLFFTLNGWRIQDSDTHQNVTAAAATWTYLNWAGWALMLVGIPYYYLVRWFLPGVEVIQLPNRSKGGRAVAAVAAFCAGIVGNVIAAFIK